MVGFECLLEKKLPVFVLESPLVGRDELLRLSEGSERRCKLKLRRRRRGLRERDSESERTDLESSPDELPSSSSSHAGVRGRVLLRDCWLLMEDIEPLMLSDDE